MRCEDGTEGCFGPSNENLRRSVIVSLVFAFFLSTVTVALRLLARRINGTKLYLDDYLILIALLFKYGCSIGVCILLYNGLGSHITEIPQKNLIIFAKIGYSNSFVYTACIAFIKLSILTLYKRLFSTRRMILASNLVAAFVILWAISIFISGALLCLPVNKFWDQSVPGHCVDTAKFYYGMQIPNILSDVVILVMPMKIVWALPIPKTQRMLLSGVFVVGGLTLVFDIVRLVAMIKLTQAGPDVTYYQAPAALWTCIEAAVGITAACLSNLRPIFKLGYRGVWSHIRSSTNQSAQPLNPGRAEKPYDSYVITERSVEIRYSLDENRKH